MVDVAPEGVWVEAGQVSPSVEQTGRIGFSAGQRPQLGNRAAGPGHGQALSRLYAIENGFPVVSELLERYIIHITNIPRFNICARVARRPRF